MKKCVLKAKFLIVMSLVRIKILIALLDSNTDHRVYRSLVFSCCSEVLLKLLDLRSTVTVFSLCGVIINMLGLHFVIFLL